MSHTTCVLRDEQMKNNEWDKERKGWSDDSFVNKRIYSLLLLFFVFLWSIFYTERIQMKMIWKICGIAFIIIYIKQGRDNDDLAEKRVITQFHYLSWPDMGVPEYYTTLINFTETVKEHHVRKERHTKSGPMLVHCRYSLPTCEIIIIIIMGSLLHHSTFYASDP